MRIVYQDGDFEDIVPDRIKELELLGLDQVSKGVKQELWKVLMDVVRRRLQNLCLAWAMIQAYHPDRPVLLLPFSYL